MTLNEQASAPVTDASVEAPATIVEETSTVPARQLIDESKRHFALKEYTSAMTKLADALEELRDTHGEDADALAPVLHLYGRSLLENFILNSAALGGGGGSSAPAPKAPKASGSSSKATAADPRFSFSGDAEDDDDDQDAPAGEGGDEEGEEEEDDLQVAFTVLDLARFIYERILSSITDTAAALSTLDEQTWSETRVKEELAQVMNDLGDVGLEGENFQQSSADYRSSLEILQPLLNTHSRRLADAHLRLGLALEFHPEVGERAAAKAHVQAASDVLGTRIKAIEDLIKAKSSTEDQNASANGKAKSTEKDDLLEMSADKLKDELAEVSAIKAELDTKLEEYDTDAGTAKLNGEPDLAAALGVGGAGNTKEALQQAIKDAFLGASDDSSTLGAASSNSGPVNDLSSMVKRKKQAPTTEDSQTQQGSSSKKARVEDEA